MMVYAAYQANRSKGINCFHFFPSPLKTLTRVKCKYSLISIAVVKLQSITRRFLGRVRYRALQFQSHIDAPLSKQSNAVVRIQSHFRGFIVRSLQSRLAGAREIIKRVLFRFLLIRYVFLLSLLI